MDIPDRIAYMEYRLGWTLVLHGKYYTAIPHLRSAIQYYRDNKDWSNAGVVEIQLANALRLMDPETTNPESDAILVRLAAYFESAGEVSNTMSIESIQGERYFDAGLFDAAAAVFGDIVARSVELEDDHSARKARASQVEALFRAGRLSEAKEVFAEIDPLEWGENNVELERIEKLKKLMLDTMALTLNIQM
jgi:tetratricopeptide (TPR) repeat protein